MFRREFGSDLLAGISIVTSVILGEYLAGTLVVLMLSGGEALEAYAVRSASSVLQALAKRMPSVAHRKHDSTLEDVALEDVQIGDVLLVLPHEICPIDGTVIEGHGVMDESYLTGEPYMMSKTPGSAVLSGSINGESALTIRADKLAVDSRYAKIMQVMQSSRAASTEDSPSGRSTGRVLHAAGGGAWRGGLGRFGRSGAISGRDGRGNALPTVDCDSRGHHRLDLAGRPPCHHRPRSGCPRASRYLPDNHLRQDGHADLRQAATDASNFVPRRTNRMSCSR